MAIDTCVPAANSGAQVAWIAPVYKNTRPLWRAVESAIAPVSDRVKVHKSERTVTFPSGGTLEIFSADSPTSILGRAFNLIVIDEAARVAEEVWTDTIQPTLADYNGDAILISTPRGKNWFYREWLRGKAGVKDYASFTAPSSDNPNPNIKHAALMARTRVSDRAYRQEWLAEFIGDGGGVFRNVRAAATGQVLPRDPAHGYVVGVDWARSGDFSVFTVIDSTTKSVVYMDRFTDVSYPVQAQRLNALYERYRPNVIIAESNAMGAPVIETLQRDGLPVRAFNTSNATKAQIIDGLALAFERGQITILNDEVCITELEAYESKRTASGMVSYSAPSGMHDDTVMSLALAYSAVSRATMKDYGWE